MSNKIKLLIVIFIIIDIIIFFYIFNVYRDEQDEFYNKVDPNIVNSLKTFRTSNPLKILNVEGLNWEYISIGNGSKTILFLHGMTGAYDIWWQQIDVLKNKYRIIALTYPQVKSLAQIEKGIVAILEAENIQNFNVIGTSMGGYIAQYLMAKYPSRIQRVILSNTFPPNDLIRKKTYILGKLLPYLPQSIIFFQFKRNFNNTIYPSSNYNQLTLAFLNEFIHKRTTKDHLVGRYYCIIEQFIPLKEYLIPVMIIESDNDPLVEVSLRNLLKETYKEAMVYTFKDAGHFPYLNYPDEYTKIIDNFYSK